jgi:hypothetical protein
VKLFISYSSVNFEQASHLTKHLINLGHDVWFAPEKINAGACFATEIDKALNSDIAAVLLFASRDAIGEKVNGRNKYGSEEVKTEIKKTRSLGLRLIPLKVDTALNEPADGFSYLLTNYQWLDIVAAITDHNYEQAAASIDRRLARPDGQIDLEYYKGQISSVEKWLKEKETERARKCIGLLDAPESLKSNIQLLKVISFLQHQKQPLKNLPKSKVDQCIMVLRKINNPEITAPTLYLQALLSKHYYSKNGITDPTIGYNNLALKAKNSERLKAKYILMTDQLILNNKEFSSDWRILTSSR